MGKDKLKKFAENKTFRCLVQPEFDEIFGKDHPLKGRWHADFFRNDRPIVLELGCGKGEYTVALAADDPARNYIGVDIKGARMWRGAKTATEQGMDNVGFLRTRIEFITSFFAPGEVSELWITFPDPQLKTRRAKKRLTAPPFLACYAQLLAPGGWINLKTDSQHLYRYTGEVIRRCGLRCAVSNPDIYGTGYADKVLSIKTAYEQMFLDRGLPITYTRFTLDDTVRFDWFDWEEDDKLKCEKDCEEARRGARRQITRLCASKGMWDEQASSDLYEVLDLLSIKQMKLLGHLLDTEEKRIEQLQTARKKAQGAADGQFII